MRSHEKASTAGSPQRQAGRLGRFSRGAGATRDGAQGADGRGAPKTRRFVLPLALLIALLSLTLGVGSATAVAPTVVSTGVSAVTTKAALLEAEINPGEEATTYHFEYGLADCSSNPCTSAPVPNGNVGSGGTAVKVTREIAGLSPGTTYHFRVVAGNATTTEGPDRTFTTFDLATPDTNCPNQAFRTGPAAHLPDCRAYEMVSPVDKNGGDIVTDRGVGTGTAEFRKSSLDGNKFTYSAQAAFGDAPSGRYGNQYLATRGADGWTTHGINPPQGTTIWDPEYKLHQLLSSFSAFTPDLSSAWLFDFNETPLTVDGLQGYPNLYRRDNLTGGYEALTNSGFVEPISTSTFDLIYGIGGYSTDLRHTFFSVDAKLTPDAASVTENGITQVYGLSDGELQIVSVLPNGTPATTASGIGTRGSGVVRLDRSDNAVSDDGSRVFWSSGPFGESGTIYLRENPAEEQSALNGSEECTEPAKACTISISGSLPNGTRSEYWTASSDGSKVVFSTGGFAEEHLLYEFDVDTETPTLIAGEAGGVAGASEDASYLYFVSMEDLAEGATSGEPNLYLNREGTIEFIASLSLLDIGQGADATHQTPNVVNNAPLRRTTRVTPDGHHLVFMSSRSLTGYDNTSANTGEAAYEVYIYDAETEQLTCASCNPSKARPHTGVLQQPYESYSDNFSVKGELATAAWLPTSEYILNQSRALSDDGNRLYFNSFDALSPQDTNGKLDVYQWERQGSGSCQKAGGCISLISTGTSPEKSEFFDATPSGNDIFFRTASSIDPRDPGLLDVYVASIGGGLAPPPVAPPCVGDSCQSAPEAPIDATPASASFKGAGNPAPRKARRNCRARKAQAGKATQKAKRKAAKRCKHAKRGASR